MTRLHDHGAEEPRTPSRVPLVLSERRLGEDERRGGGEGTEDWQAVRAREGVPARVRAFVLTLRYSGLRIGDCVALKKEHVDGDRLFLRTQKTGEPVYLPLPEIAVDALKPITNGSEYFFWTGNGLRKSAVADWQRSLRRVLEERVRGLWG